MKEKIILLLSDQRFLVAAWVLQTLWYLVMRILLHMEIVSALTTVLVAGNVLLAYLVPIYTLAFVAFGFIHREGYIRYKAIPLLTFIICYIGQSIVYWLIERFL